jgi:hypothetical protein
MSSIANSTAGVQQLNGLLTISTKALQLRDKNSVQLVRSSSLFRTQQSSSIIIVIMNLFQTTRSIVRLKYKEYNYNETIIGEA